MINTVFEGVGFMIDCQDNAYFLQADNEKELWYFIVSLYAETKTLDELKSVVTTYVVDNFTVNCDLCCSYYSCFAHESLIHKSQGVTMSHSSTQVNYPKYPLIKRHFPNF